MARRKGQEVPKPSMEQVEAAKARNEYKQRYKRTLGSTVSVLIVVAAIAVLISSLLLPVIQVSGNSMEPTLYDGDILVLVKTAQYQRGNLVCISWQNKRLLKRVIGLPGDKVSMDGDGNVYVNEVLLEEPYLMTKSLGDVDIEFPCYVPDDRLFVLGDQREVSVDSRFSGIGCVKNEQVIGRVLFKAWPIDIGPFHLGRKSSK